MQVQYDGIGGAGGRCPAHTDTLTHFDVIMVTNSS